MANINKLNCATSNNKNVGFGSCVLDPKEMSGVFIVPNDFEIDDDDLATPETIFAALEAAAKDDAKLVRIYPVHSLLELTDNTEKKVIKTYKNGGKSVVREGDYDWTYTFTEGALCLLQGLRSFNSNGQWSFIFYDKAFQLFGRKNADGNLAGIPTRFIWAEQWGMANGADPAIYMIQFVFMPIYINENLAFAQADATLIDVKGLQDANLELVSWDEPTAVAHVRVSTDCGGVNLGEFFSTELAANGVWQATNADTGDPIGITSVTYNASGGFFVITLDDEDGDWPATTEGILLDLRAVSVLDAADIVGYESTGSLTLPTT